MNPPEWWIQAIRNDYSIDMDASQKTLEKLMESWKKNNEGWVYYGIDSVANEGDGLQVESEGQSLLIPKDGASGYSDHGWNSVEIGAVSGVFSNDVFAMSVCGGECGPTHASAYSLDSGQLKWSRELRSTLPGLFGSGGAWGSLSEVAIERDSVIIWVAHDYGVGVEILDLANGDPVAFFSSAQSSIDPPGVK